MVSPSPMTGDTKCLVSRSAGGEYEIWYGYWKLESAEYALALGPEEDSNVCVKWGGGSIRDIFDDLWKLGKSIGVLGSFTTISVAAINCFLIWSRFSLGWFYPLIAVHVFNAFLSFMLLIALRSTLCGFVGCVLARGGYIAIVGGIFWLIAAFLLVLVRRKEAEMIDEPIDIDLRNKEPEKRLALPAPEEMLALPAPGDDEEEPSSPGPRRKMNNVPSSREIPLALPLSESATSEQQKSPKPKRKSSANAVPLSSSNRTNDTAPESPRPSSTRTSVSKSPRKGTRPSTSKGDGETLLDSRPASPRKSPTKSPKKGSAMTNSKSPGTKKKKKASQSPDDIPEI